jgi:hypothetical protein
MVNNDGLDALATISELTEIGMSSGQEKNTGQKDKQGILA